MLRSRFWECLNLLGSTCVFHSIYSVFVLSDNLWFGIFFPVEFATPVAVAVLRLEPLQLQPAVTVEASEPRELMQLSHIGSLSPCICDS